ncbi:ABC transporter ATP-binding protein [Nitratireductor indicus]|uniref:Branched-chain amino acid transport ATP-binding protein n=1 Tax=Nitratireductor indicus C115 TaxID=1231190 RepID=K2NY90_9HYPH|nr:ABC transporter ATP-binding protein [Nitratireductor indicus]EKF44195.1 branched-chain amino acid transport ATP-binding protein [Nitratireductor indicus C115]MDS1137153.1 ABC transporter ATP-binding protein [Nitratireductor indicus]SFQ25139.1 branched-chain amino acid transport system ATP-binding protein/neutral amino acid transport system ATP-binding protein [Nitratireductor indicus]
MSLLVARDIVAGYGAAEQILKKASIHVEAGEIVTIIGPNGAGKSTLLKVVAGLVPAREGSIQLGGEDVTRFGAVDRTRSGISFVPQERNVFGNLSIAENLEISAYRDSGDASRRIEELYERYPMLAGKRRDLARTLSGGQRQILAMAMGLMTAPKLLLLDEPTAGLSPRAADELFDAIVALNRGGLPILMVEQHAVEALAVSTRGYVLVSGKESAEGPGPQLAADPEIRRLFLGG